MCGIVGIMSKRKSGIFHVDMDIFSELLFANQLRGAHGTGIFYDDKTSCSAFKGPMPSSVFLRSKGLDEVIAKIIRSSTFVIGHNRHATKGAINFENTHPFVVGDITLIHNGTLPYHKHLKDVEVDSCAITHAINEKGHVEVLKDLDGAFALAWHDTKDNNLYFTRNTERPLYILETDNLFIISSEQGLAEWIVKRKNQTLTEVPAMCEVGQLYCYNTKTNQLTSEKIDIRPKYSANNYKGKWMGGGYDYETNTYDNKKWLPETKPVRNNQYSIDVRTGDRVIFSPIDVHPHGKTFMLQGLAETLIYNEVHTVNLNPNEEMIVKMYHGSEQDLNSMLDYALCSARVIQVVWKGSKKSVVVSDVKPIVTLPESIPEVTYN